MDNLRTIARKTKASLIHYQQGDQPNIAIIATIRGGSTLVADMLAAQKGMWFADEPFAPHHERWLGPQLKALSHRQIKEDCRFFNLDGPQYNEIDDYIRKLNSASGGYGTSRRTLFPLNANRACFKILRASWLTDFFAEQQGMQVLFVMRHPAAQALSVMRLGWPHAAEIYFAQPNFLMRDFSEDQIEYGLKILAEGSELQKGILSWIFDVIYPLKYSKQVACKLFYEHLVNDPKCCIQYLCNTLGLKDSHVMSQIIGHPSGSSSFSKVDVKEAIISGNSQLLLKKWCSQLDDYDRKDAQKVLDKFEITCYCMYDFMPKVDII